MFEKAHLLCERLADFNAAEVDDALDLLLRGLCEIAGAQNAYWIGSGPRETRHDRHRTAVHILHSGRPLATSLVQETSSTDPARGHLIGLDLPIDDDAESCFGISRDPCRPPFSAREWDAVTYVLRSLKRFHRHLMLSYGLLLAESPLTPVERRVLKHLLGGLSEKQIAIELAQSFHTTHEYVRNIYRKFGVNNRATLMTLWLGKRA